MGVNFVDRITWIQAAVTFARQTGWSGCIARLLVKEVIQPEADSVVSVEDVISLEDDQETADQVVYIKISRV
jgi:hypothetical protein